LFLGTSTKTAATRAALFDYNMHQIVSRLGLGKLRERRGQREEEREEMEGVRPLP